MRRPPEAAGAAPVVCGRLRVSVGPWFARMVLASELQQFLVRYPLLSVDFSTSNYRQEMMTGVDVAMRFRHPDESSLIVRKLLETRILTVAAPAYLENTASRDHPMTPSITKRFSSAIPDRPALSLGVPARRGGQGGQGLQSPGNG